MPQVRFRRVGWLAILSLCVVCYALLHIRVNAVHSEVVRAEREIVRLEERNLLLETEVLTRSSQLKLAQWNRVEFGYHAPTPSQYLEGERQLAAFSGPRAQGAPPPIRLAAMTTGKHAPAYPTLARAEPRRATRAAAGKPADHLRVAILTQPSLAQPTPIKPTPLKPTPIKGSRQP